MYQDKTEKFTNMYQVFQKSLDNNHNMTGINELTENGNKYCTYKELFKKTEEFLSFISQIGLSKGTRVGLFIENGIERVYKVLALVKRGIVFVPLDPAYNKQTIEQIIKEAHLTYIILGENSRTNELWYQYDINIKTFCVISLFDNSSHLTNGTSYDNIDAEDPVCVIFTSGSTGGQKGVILSQKNFLAMVEWYSRKHNLKNSTDVLCLHTNCVWITYWMEIFTAVLNCINCISLTDEYSKNFPLFSNFLREYKVTMLFAIPTLLIELIKWTEINTTLKIVGTGGECIPPNILTAFLKHFPNAALFNEYGLTESTGIALATLDNMFNYASSLIIGYPLECIRAYIVSNDGCLVSDGDEGELWISGATIATGYIKEEDNNKFFMKNSFENNAIFSKVFKTGDYVKMTKDGIEFIGRKDNVTKIRGKKVNIFEVENVIKELFPNIELYIIKKYDIKKGQWVLCAFYKTQEDVPTTVFRSATCKIFSSHLISKFVKIDNFPKLITGKINRNELSKYFLKDCDNDTNLNYLLESKFKIDKLKYGVCKILDLYDDEFDPNKNFFEHGGDSITVFSFLEEVKNFGLEFTINELTTSFNDLCEVNCNGTFINTALSDEDHIQGVLFTDLNDSEIDFIIQRMTEAFLTKEPMFMFHASKGFDFGLFFKLIVKECRDNHPHLCMAIKIHNKIMGAFVTCPMYGAGAEYKFLDYMPKEFHGLTDYYGSSVIQKLLNHGHNIADSLTMYVDSDSSNVLSMRLFYMLCCEQLKLVKENGFTALFSFNLSPATQGITKNIFKSSVESILYPSQFKYNEDFPYKEFDPGYYMEIAVDYLNDK
ncbi:gramicidin S synthase 2 [Hydra vulgaris]|uniref:gramicidin S synthase 2 n=1 Tax=Hydra vulgaris TaxID=6087 RepID=UPI001F5F39E7|nr:gramicidin S synthase 2-like [Hydra vulgaris]